MYSASVFAEYDALLKSEIAECRRRQLQLEADALKIIERQRELEARLAALRTSYPAKPTP